MTQSLRARIIQQMEQLEMELEFLDTMPEEPTDPQAVVVFWKAFPAAPAVPGRVYQYAAVKSRSGLWRTTAANSRTGNDLSWEDLLAWMLRDGGKWGMWLVTEMDHVGGDPKVGD